MIDSNKIAVVGLALNVILAIANMAWAWFLNKKTIQATLQAATPKPKATKEKKLGPKQRLALERLEAAKFIAIVQFISLSSNSLFLIRRPFLTWFSLTYVTSLLFFVAASGRVLVLLGRTIRAVKAGNRSVIKEWSTPSWWQI